MTRFRTWDEYFYPGTLVLRNKPGFRDASKLRLFEEKAANYEISHMLKRDPVEGHFDRDHMRAIHQRIFRGVYEWAGLERVGPVFPQQMVKGGPSPESIANGDFKAPDQYGYAYFPAGSSMVEHFDKYAGALHQLGDLRGETPSGFAEKIAEPWGEINTAHLFREGNTRAQIVFFTLFARKHQQDLDHERFADDSLFRAKFNAGRFLIQDMKGDDLFKEVLTEAFSGNSAASMNPATGTTATGEEYDDYMPNYASHEVPHPRPNLRQANET